MTTNAQAHIAALRRLSQRANMATATATAAASAKSSSAAGPLQSGLDSFAGFADGVIAALRRRGVAVEPGLTEAEFQRIEAALGFTFPPDLRAVLRAGVPAGPGFPDWRAAPGQLRMRLGLPTAGLAYEAARGGFWLRRWGPRPATPERALAVARARLGRAPALVPVLGRCYLPALPNRAGNPVLFVHRGEVLCCAADLSELFFAAAAELDADDSAAAATAVLRRDSSLGRRCRRGRGPSADDHLGKSFSVEWPRRSVSVSEKPVPASAAPPRWIEFWSEAAQQSSRNNQHCTAGNAAAFLQTTTSGELFADEEESEESVMVSLTVLPRWVEDYLEGLAEVLRRGGWKEQDITEMLHRHLAAQRRSLPDTAVIEGLVLQADVMATTLRSAGWTSRDVSDALQFDFAAPRRPPVTISAGLAQRIGKLAQSVAHA